MPLPNANEPWPPKAAAPIYDKMAEWAAWYSGEPSRIVDIYAARTSSPAGVIPWYRFYRRAAEAAGGYQRAMLHVPVTSDLCAVSASLLFGESPRFRIKEAHEDEAPEPLVDPTDEPIKGTRTPEQKAERRMLEIIERGGVRGRLLEAAEAGAAIGGVYMYPVWDTDLIDIPIVAVAQADMALPEFKWGILVAVTFHRVVNVVGSNEVYRHIERHEVEGVGEDRKAVVLNALYKGTKDTLGVVADLTASEATLRLEARVEMPFKELDVEYVPNIRPNRLFRANAEGVADIQGSESLLDAIDETYASWMRDIRLAKARIIVPRDYLRNDEDGNATFDIDQEIYTTMDMEPSMDADARSMLAHQFNIRYMEHRETTREFIERVVSNAGYSPETVIGSESAAPSGAALRVSEHKTILTQRRKAGHWVPALSRLLYHLNLIDKEIFKSDALDIRPSVEMSDSVIDQPLELAQTALALKSAEAASIESRVRVVNPDWSDAEVAAEVARIKDDTAVAAQVDAEAKGMFGDPDAAPEARGSNFPTKGPKTGKADGPTPTPPPFAKKA